MERVVRWVDLEKRDTRSGGTRPGTPWQGATLRPTGVVVFATLERPGRARSCPVPAPLMLSHRGAPAALPHRWRRRAALGVAWLLGR